MVHVDLSNYPAGRTQISCDRRGRAFKSRLTAFGHFLSFFLIGPDGVLSAAAKDGLYPNDLAVLDLEHVHVGQRLVEVDEAGGDSGVYVRLRKTAMRVCRR